MKYKLFVVGEKSSNPEDWSIWSELSLVIAENKEEALKLCDRIHNDIATEIPLNKPLFLIHMPEPSWGRDI